MNYMIKKDKRKLNKEAQQRFRERKLEREGKYIEYYKCNLPNDTKKQVGVR